MKTSTFKKLARLAPILLIGGFLLALVRCDGDDITSSLNINITDSPTDADTVAKVNIVISDIEWRQNGEWESIRYIEDPISIDVLSLTNGQVFSIVNQITAPGKYSELRLTMQCATQDGNLIMNPQSNIEFTDGSLNYLYWYNDEPTQVILESNFEIISRNLAQLVIDLDLRKSISQNASGDYILEPSLRLLDASKVGAIEALITNNEAERILAYVYRSNTFSDSELNPSDGSIDFKNAITSSRLSETNKLLVAFLEEGEYELIFVEHDKKGKAINIIKRYPDVQIKLGELTKIKVNF